MDYARIYRQLIEQARKRATFDGYFENHHVIPKSFGGSDDASNLVRLTAREHFLAHWLLHRIHQTSTTALAWLRMTTLGPNLLGRSTSHHFERARKAASAANTGRSNRTSKVVVNMDTGAFFVSARAASLFYGLKLNGVASQIRAGGRVKGFRLVYADDPFRECSEGYGVKKKKPVVRLSDGVRFPSASEASIAIGRKENAVNIAIGRGTRTAGSYWKYEG